MPNHSRRREPPARGTHAPSGTPPIAEDRPQLTAEDALFFVQGRARPLDALANALEDCAEEDLPGRLEDVARFAAGAHREIVEYYESHVGHPGVPIASDVLIIAECLVAAISACAVLAIEGRNWLWPEVRLKSEAYVAATMVLANHLWDRFRDFDRTIEEWEAAGAGKDGGQ